MDSQSSNPSDELTRIVASARRLGVEMNENEAIQWLAAIATAKSEVDVVVDIREGIFGHRISMLDFAPERLVYFRKIGKLVEFSDEPGVVETALALSGSAAQSRIQTFPGDADFFERVNIVAPTRDAACAILARVMRDKALTVKKVRPTSSSRSNLVPIHSRFLTASGQQKAGAPIAWTPQTIRAGKISGKLADGSDVRSPGSRSARPRLVQTGLGGGRPA